MSIKDAITDLKDALIDLKPTGEDGFEGLLAVVLGKITGQEFRLAGSGSQHGKDGEALSSTSHLTFEGKLYTGDIPKNEVLSKATEIIGGTQIPDAWIIGATVVVKPQILGPLQNAFEKNAISMIVLDWPETVAIPPLACACALADNAAKNFLKQNIQDKQKVKKALAAIDSIRADENFAASSAILQRELEEPTLGAPIALKINRLWLSEAFSDRKRARQVFGQTLAPMAVPTLTAQSRPQLEEALEKAVFGAPHPRVVSLVGDEGCGKSWLFAKVWSQCSEQPLTVVIPASDLKEVAAYGEIEGYLIDRLIGQTGDSATDFKRNRWRRRFEQWKACEKHVSTNLVVFVDGLNQNPEFEWGRWLDGANVLLEKLGGILVISARQSYFRDHVKGTVTSDIQLICVPEWTIDDLSQILARKGIKLADVHPAVVKTLQNPRILGIALELLDNTQIENITELSVERLLFEHIRQGAKENNSAENVEQFKNRLSQHAEEIINRVKAQKHEDRLVFESGTSLHPTTYNLSADLLAVTQGRFFNPLPDDSTLYSLTDDGLAVALGLSIIKTLQKAKRNNRDLSDAIDELLEPIAALDKTSQAVFTALLVASIDERCTSDIQQVLIEAFLQLQNIDTGYFPAFSSAVRTATEASMNALFKLSTSKRHVANKDWLLAALREGRKHDQCWLVMSKGIDRWLRLYSLSPELGVLSTRTAEGKAKVEEETEKCRLRLTEKLNSLPSGESTFLKEKMLRDDKVDPADIASEAFVLLAGRPLAGFGQALAAWCYSQSLNSSYRTPHEEFQFLVQQNRADWVQTREALFKESESFRTENASRTGKWAMVAILRATATLKDAENAMSLYDELTADREKYPGWRLVEKYCPVDPCDPSSIKPDEIDATADRYNSIDASKSANSRWMGENDHFLRDALPGVARFAGDVAISMQRSLASDIADRDVNEFKMGLFALEPKAALLTADLTDKFLQKAMDLSSPYDRASEDARDCWVDSQYSLLVVFPHLEGDKQLESLMSLPHPGPTLLKLTYVLKPASMDSLDHALDQAWQSGDEYLQSMVLMFARYSGSLLSQHGKEMVARMCTSASSTVRAQAFNVIAYLKDCSLIEGVAHGSWRGDALDPKAQYFEIWHGSEVLLQAGVEGILSTEEVLTRISPKLFGHAASLLGQNAQTAIAECLNTSIETALAVEIAKKPPAVEQNVNSSKDGQPPLLSLADTDEELRPEEFFKHLSESAEEFDARQKRGWEAFDRFEKSITRDKARLIIEDVGIDAVEALFASTPERALGWAEAFLELSDHKLGNIQHMGFKLARTLSKDHPALAGRLFERLEDSRAFINFTYGVGAIPLEAISIWAGADNPEIDAIRRRRLDGAANDDEIATEALSALTCGKAAFLEQYATALLEREEPAAKARSLMIFGFGLESPQADAVFEEFADANGLIGTAVQAARFAYDRNRWSRHWFEQMRSAETGEEFWRYSVLFLKIADARFELWEDEIERVGASCREFEPSIENKLENRIKSWAKKREKTLFGAKAPNGVFLSEA